jgi:CRISPR system Cascade subunit CasE
MYLSRLKMDLSRRTAREFLINHYQLHLAVYRAFPDAADGGPGRVLYRVDQSEQSAVLFVQSKKKPDWTKAEFLYNSLLVPPECKLFAPSIQTGQTLFFYTRTNPTIRQSSTGRRIGITNEADQLAWLRRKGEDHGFTVISCQVMNEGISNSDRGFENKDKLRHFGVRFSGLLKISDQAQFMKTLENGIGSSKGFGFGLLSLAPAL